MKIEGMKMLRFAVLLTAIFLGCASSAMARTIATGLSESMQYKVEEVARGQGVIWSLTFLSDELLLFTERRGSIKTLNLKSGVITRIAGAPPVWSNDQGGMLDSAVVQEITMADWIYFTYSKDINGRGATTLARAHLRQDMLTDWQDLLVTKSATETGRHFGSRIAFDDSGHLFFSVGERGVRLNAQNLFNHAGSILRLNLDGSVPRDNPFVGQGGLPEIWSYGHRNPQGLFWQSGTQELWSNEHGPRGGDEINRIEPGGNYGWPIVSHGKEYWGPIAVGEATSRPGMVNPKKIYIPSIAPGSLLIYSGEAFPGWRGNFFSGALALAHLNRVVFDEHDQPVKEERLLIDLDERIRDVIQSPEGWLYLSTDSGRILSIRPL